jgi:hypothetical protein
MLKRIPKSDISIRPFKAYKEWSFSSGSTLIDLLEADSTSTDLSGLYPKNSIHGNIKSIFYNGQDDNPINRIGLKTNTYTIFTNAKERNLESYAKVISIPNIYVGEGMKKSSITITDGAITYIDDGFGNLRGNDVVLRLDTMDFNSSFITYFNLENVIATVTIVSIDVTNMEVVFSYNSINYTQTIIELDLQNNILEVDKIPFLDDITGIIGNVFYNQGIIVFTKYPTTRLLNNWQLSYKSTQTIYEHEYLLISNEDEFNVSTNPTAVVEVGRETEFITGSDNKIYKVTTNPGVKYIRKKSTLENGNILDYRFTGSYSGSNSASFAGFEHYDLSGSADTTGSFLTPMITTIGLYDDDCQLLGVAKLPQPIKSEPDIPVNFIVRFDT